MAECLRCGASSAAEATAGAAESCAACGARLTGLDWCNQCLTPINQPVLAAVLSPSTGSDPWNTSRERWTDESVPAVLRARPLSQPQPPTLGNVRYATWWQRVKATLVDELLLVALALLLLFVGVGYPVAQAVVSAVFLANTVFLQGMAGHTIGKRVVGIQVVRGRDHRPVGIPLVVVRHLAHVLDAFTMGLGYLWPLVDKKKRTFADMVCRTVVIS